MAPQAKPMDVGAMTPRQLLQLFAYLGFLNSVKRAGQERTHIAPAKGTRGLKRRAKKARLKAHRARLQRVTWCSHGEALKKGARA